MPGGVAREIAPEGAAQVEALARRGAARISAPDRTLRQHRLAAGSHRHHRHREARTGAPIRRRRLCRTRLAAVPSMRAVPSLMRPTTSSPSRCRCSTPVMSMRGSGYAFARSSRACRLIEQILDALPKGAIKSRDQATARCREGLGLAEGFRGDVLVWLRLDSKGRVARCHLRDAVMVPVAAAGSRDRGQHRRRLPALQQIFQLLLFRARSVGLIDAQDPAREPAHTARSPSQRPLPMKLHSPSLRKTRRPHRSRQAWSFARPFARSMPVPAMVASWKSMRSIMRSTISSALACALLLRHAMPMC